MARSPSLYLFVMFVSLGYTNGGHRSPAGWTRSRSTRVFTFALIPISIGVAVLRYRLWDIDIVISKTVVFGLLVAFITLVYVAVVVGIGTVLGNPRDPALSIAATALVALLFGPVRERVRRFANRLVYGKRATPVRGDGRVRASGLGVAVGRRRPARDGGGRRARGGRSGGHACG